MAEFCVDCWNKLHGTHYTKQDVRTDLDLCEGCGQWKPVIVVFRPRGLLGLVDDLRVFLWERYDRWQERRR